MRSAAAQHRGTKGNKYSAFGSPYNGMTQMSSAIIAAVKPSMEYAKLCMGMRLRNVRYSADQCVTSIDEASTGGGAYACNGTSGR